MRKIRIIVLEEQTDRFYMCDDDKSEIVREIYDRLDRLGYDVRLVDGKKHEFSSKMEVYKNISISIHVLANGES